MLGFRLFVIIVFKLVKAPNMYAPLSPKKIFALGKLNNRKDKNTIIWDINKTENSKFSLLIFIWVRIIFIIIRFIVNKPLKPSIKLAPLITNKKHNKTKIEENKWLDINGIRNGISMFKIFTGKKYIITKRRNIIITNLLNGFILIFKSSKNPTKNIE